ncbi:MAG: hypothetical protein GXP38_04030, partial [Chloroflexi bacterium]|nr:hypothetical protein [Chloroflexota bacterium]
MTRLLYLIIALILALVAQHWLTEGGIPRDALIFFVLGGGLFAWAAEAPPSWPALPGRRRWQRWGLALAVAAVVVVLAVAFTRFWSGQYGGWGLWLWLLAVVAYMVGTWIEEPVESAATEPDKIGNSSLPSYLNPRLVLILLLAILLIATAVRFYALDTYPNGCQSDECNNGLDALKWLSGAPYMPYAETNEGQATLFTYVIALFIKLFGQSVTSMRMVSASVGVLTVLAFYALARELYNRPIALLTAALLAADRWHLTFSRIVYELIMMPLVLSLQMWFLIKALKTGRRRWWALSGLMLALGMNTYTAYRVVPFLTGLYFLYWLIAHRQRIRQDFEGMLTFAGAALVGVAPLGVYIIRNWNVFISRINHISIFRDVEAAGSYAPLWSNLEKTLFMFNWKGDNAALNNLPGAPLLQSVVAALLILAVFWAVRWLWKELPFLYVTWFLAIGSLAVLSVAHEAPTARRPIGLVPVIYLLVAAVFDQFWRAWIRAWGQKRWRPLAVGLTVIVLYVMGSNIHTYFRVQAVDPSVWGAYSPNESAVGEYLATVPESVHIYMTPQYTHHSAVKFIGGPHKITVLNLAQHIPLREDPGADVEFILEPVDERLVPLLQQLYPGGTYNAHRDRYGRTLFLSYHVPRALYDAARGLQAVYIAGTDPSQPPAQRGKQDSLQVDFATSSPLPPPFVARFQGALLAPKYGAYTFEVDVRGGEAALYLDESEVLRVRDGRESLERTLAGGFQGLKVVVWADTATATLSVRWATPDNPQLHPIDEGALYNLPGASNGLVGYYYHTPDWSGTPNLIQRDLFILPNNILREPFSIRWVGKIAAPVSGTYLFATRSDDGSLVYIDDQLVVDNSGSHGAQDRQGTIELSEGFHDIQVLYNELGGSREMQLWWQPPGRNRSIIPSIYLYPVEDELPSDLVLPPLPSNQPPEPVVSQPGGGIQPQPEPVAPAPPAASALGDFPNVQLDVLWTYGTCGSGKKELQKPMGVAVDGNGDVYIADMANQRLVHLDATGKRVGSWGEAGEGPGQFTEVFDLVVTPSGDIAVLDAVNQVISVWLAEGDFARQFGADLATYRPRGLGITPAGEYLIADTGGVRVLLVGPDGQRLQQFGGPDAELGPGQPTDAAYGPGDIIYVVEPISGALWRVDAVSGQMQRYPSPEANTIESPHLAVSSDGRIFVTDPEGGRVLVYSADMQPLAQFGGKGTQAGLFSRPVGIAL